MVTDLLIKKINVTKNENKFYELKKLIFLLKKYFNTKEISSDDNYHFKFKSANWYLTVIYFLTFIIMPISYSLIKAYVYHIPFKTNVPVWNELDLFFNILIPIFGLFLTFALDWNTMTKKGAWAAYTHFIFGIFSNCFISLFLIQTKVINDENKNSAMSMASQFFIQVIIQFIGSIIVILTNKELRIKIWTTLKEAKIDLLIWVMIFSGIITLLDLIFNAIPNQTDFFSKNNINASTNQNNLKLIASIPFGAFTLVLGSVFLAPINEEISYRYGTFSIVHGKFLGYLASLIYFPSMHIMYNGDWNHIFGYLAVSIMAPLLFIISRGNTTYTLGLHMMGNAFATISIFIGLAK